MIKPFKFCICLYVVCTDCENDKIQLTSHSRFEYIESVACMKVNGNLTVHNVLITRGILKMARTVCREVDEVREERLRRRTEHDRLRRERN